MVSSEQSGSGYDSVFQGEEGERGADIINIKREEGCACVLCGSAVSASATIPVK